MTTAMESMQGVVDDFEKDSSKENKGVQMTYRNHRYLVARAHRNNVGFLKLMETEMRPYQWAIDRGNFAAIKGVALEIMYGVYAKTILLGVEKLDGTKLAYTPEAGVELFKRLPDLWDAVQQFAQNEMNYSPEQVEADSKN